MSKYTHGMTTEEHNNIDGIDIYNTRMYEALAAHLDKDGLTVVDAFSGGPRDILKMMKVTNGHGSFAAIDPDPERIKDLLERNYDISKLGEIDFEVPKFELVEGPRQLELSNGLVRAFQNSSVAVIQHSFPSAKTGTKLPYNLKADFMLCNAGIMFVPPENLDLTLSEMSDLLFEGGELVLRFSQARDDKANDLGTSYFIHDPDHVQAVLEDRGLETVRFDDVIDPQAEKKPERNFSWVDISAYKPVRELGV